MFFNGHQICSAAPATLRGLVAFQASDERKQGKIRGFGRPDSKRQQQIQSPCFWPVHCQIS